MLMQFSMSGRTVLYGTMHHMLSEKFDRSFNSLNAVRLLMAVGVIFWHSFPLTGNDLEQGPLRQFLGHAWVDGFFAISGFLITGAWLSKPQVRHYVVNRLLRILPAFYVCLFVTALVIAPFGVFMQGGDWRGLLASSAPLEYIGANFGVWIFQSGIGDTPEGIPYPGTWNGSLWTLGWELLCYIGVLALGAAGLLRRSMTIPLVFAAALAGLSLCTIVTMPFLFEAASRFAVMFLAGALIFQFQHRIPCSWPVVGIATAITAAAMWLPDYRVVGALTWAYVVLSVGALVKYRPIEMKTWDISYGVYIYAFPIQQLLIIAGLTTAHPVLFGALATLPTVVFALLSRRFIELPAMKLKDPLGGRRIPPARVGQDGPQ
ncbi:MAG: peptidoglycan/LPS O-acetylase OafA/YrhL [Rhodococcus sp. (in: high G+C Gram-positive bacteria)]|jgi:peptidoglycan/LPS O-acetylase OafA/YrhL